MGFAVVQIKGTGAYEKLSIRQTSKQFNLRYANRLALSNQINKVSLSDADAYSQAVETWTQLLGVPKAQIPVAPANAKNPFPIKTIYAGISDGTKTVKTIELEKLVSVQRGLFVGGELGWIPGPGKLKMSLNDAGIGMTSIQNWADMSQYGKNLNPARVKSRKQLVNELALLFQKQGIFHVYSAKSLLAIAQLDNDQSTVEPVLRVFVSPQPRDADEQTQSRAVSTAGLVLDVPLLQEI